MRLAAKSPRLFISILVAVACLSTTESKPEEPDKTTPPAADSMLGKKAGQVRDDNGLKMKLIWCPPGFVEMEDFREPDTGRRGPSAGFGQRRGPAGDRKTNEEVPNEKPDPATRSAETGAPVKVLLSRGYWLGKYEVTQSEWNEVMRTKPWEDDESGKEGDDYPATFVNWARAMSFCQKMTNLERAADRLPAGWEYTLPTEAQWERACRARTETRFSFGDDESNLGDYAWFEGNAWNAGEEFAHRVGLKKANPWGLHDMYGNVNEWCRDYYAEKLPGGRDPEVTADGKYRIFRGGGFGAAAASCGSGKRTRITPEHRGRDFGFRVALSSVREAKPGESKAEPATTNGK